MENKYYAKGPDSDQDKIKTEELKKYSAQLQSGPSSEADRRQSVMNRASDEIERRSKNVMLYSKIDYSEASRRVLAADVELAELYAQGYVAE